MAMNILVKTC